MRGKEDLGFSLTSKYRITPAYAGKSRCGYISPALSWDHPRLCGEKANASGSRLKERGSPPPMRGKASRVAADTMIEGITPAYAGKRLSALPLHRLLKDHPRLCGEKKMSMP